MKKIFKVFSLSILGLLLLTVLALLLARYVFNRQLNEPLGKDKIELLKNAGKYAPDSVSYNFVYQQDTAKALQIREYFRLDTIVKPTEVTWNRAIALARFVAKNIPHANQNNYPKKCNAIGLWEYTRTIEPAFNCRLHSILLHELLLSEGIVNRFVTCLPADSLDSDCHVVNQVWLPEIQKWAMLDSDMRAWAEDENGTPLSLAEMRERYINGQEIIYRPLLDSENNFNYYKMYWAKNLYWFISWEVTGYSREDNNPAFSNHDREIILVPKGFSGFDLSDKSVLTTDESRFWAVPDSLTVSL